jgi:uncharacterized protein (UPF0147 family)
MKQSTEIRKAIEVCDRITKDESMPKKDRVNAGIEKIKLIHKLKNLLYKKTD